MKTFNHFVQWVIQTNLSVEQCFHFDTTNKEIPECILKNMNEYKSMIEQEFIMLIMNCKKYVKKALFQKPSRLN